MLGFLSFSVHRQQVQNCPHHLSLQDGSSLLFSCQGLFEHLDVLLAVRELVGEGLQLGLQGQQLGVLAGQLLLHLANLKNTPRTGRGTENLHLPCKNYWKYT